MTSIKNLSYLKSGSKCFLCRFLLEPDELTSVTNTGHRLCLTCTIEKLNLRVDVLKDWLFEKEKLKKDIINYLEKNKKVQNRYALKELEK